MAVVASNGASEPPPVCVEDSVFQPADPANASARRFAMGVPGGFTSDAFRPRSARRTATQRLAGSSCRAGMAPLIGRKSVSPTDATSARRGRPFMGRRVRRFGDYRAARAPI